MRSMFRGVLVALVLLLVSGVATASAVAAPEYFINKVKLSGTETVTTTGGEYKFVSTVSGTEAKITCKKSTSAGTLQSGGQSTARFKFEECKAEAPRACKLTEAEQVKIEPAELTGQLEEVGGAFFDKFEQQGGKGQGGLVTITFEKCSNSIWNGAHEVTGSWRGQLDSPHEALSHTITFSPTSGSLISWFGGNSITWTTSLVSSLSGANKGKTFGINQ